MDFVHLHVHSHYSREDGVASVQALVDQAKKLGFKELALTDHNTLAGVPEFCHACTAAGIRPIIGCELDVVPHNAKVAAENAYRLVLLVESEAGYRNLVWLVNRAFFNAKRETPLLRISDFQGRATGLIALAGGVSSELFQLLINSQLDDTETYLTQLARVFGRENVVFEMQDHNLPRQWQVNERIMGLSEYLGMPAIATNNVCYIRPEDSICHDFLRGERPPAFLDFHVLKNGLHSRHLASAEQMRNKFQRYPSSVSATLDIASRCAFHPNFEKRRFPVHDFVRGFDADSFLWDLTFREARSRFADLSQEMKNRLNEEFDYIKSRGLSNNFLLLWNVASFCRQQKINMGVGHGNMVSSLVSYILGITRLNPLEFKLRFLGFGEQEEEQLRLSVEIPMKHEKALQSFLKETFGEDFCCAIGKYSMYTRTAMAREVCTWLNFPRVKLNEAMENLDLKHLSNDSPIESFFPDKEDGAATHCAEAVNYILTRLLPRPRTQNREESQFAVSGENLNHITPRVQLDDELVTQMDLAALESFHIPRLNIVVNPVLNILDAAAAWARTEENTSFDPDRIPMDDSETYDLLSKGLTNGIDPFHSITLKSLLRAHRPRNFMGLVKIKSMEKSGEKETDPDVRDHVPECLLTYRCAFIKAHYPISFFASLLTHSYRSRKKFTVILREAKKQGIRILPPDINLSVYEFSQGNKAIRTGLMVVSGMSERTYSELARIRKSGDFNDLMDLVRRTDAKLLNIRVLTNLVKTGALDSFGLKRAQMLRIIENDVELARKSAGSPSLFDESSDRAAAASGQDNGAVPELPVHEIIRHEIAAAGYCISHDQLHLYRDIVRQCRALAPDMLTPRMVGREVHVAGYLEHVEEDSPLVEEVDEVLLDLEGHVVTMPTKASKLYSLALNANAPVLVGGTVQRRKDEIYVKALTAFTLRMVQQMSQQVLQIDLDLSGEDSRTLRLIKNLVGYYKGSTTKIKILNYGGSLFGGWHMAKIEKTPVFFSPPFYYALKKILPEDRISLIASDEMDPALLHALSPTRFPKAESTEEEFAEAEENSSVVDAY